MEGNDEYECVRGVTARAHICMLCSYLLGSPCETERKFFEVNCTSKKICLPVGRRANGILMVSL